jgi:hypothetical protein
MNMTDNDVKKLIEAMKPVFATKEDVAEIKTDLASIETKLEDVADTVNAHTLQLANLASKHDLETLLEKSWSLALLKTEHNHMKKLMQEKWHVEI